MTETETTTPANGRWPNSGAACDTEAEVIEFFGTRWLAKELYAKAGIEAVEIID